MDLSTLDTTTTAEQGAVMELRHPATRAVLMQENKQPVTITLAGEDSERYRKAQRATNNRRLAASNGRRQKLTAEELETDALDNIVACTIAWSGVGLGAGELECTKANIREVYTRLPWAREQAEAFVLERGNFLAGSATN